MTDIETLALDAEAEMPDNVTDATMVVDHSPGSKIQGTGYPSGLGGVTKYGVAWIIRGREVSATIAMFDTALEARTLLRRLTNEEGALWELKTRRRARIEAIEAAEKAEEEESSKATTGGGAGSSRPKRFRKKRSESTSKRSEKTSAANAAS